MLNTVLSVPMNQQIWFLALFIWSTVWKGFALWKSARKGEQWWFVAFLIVNTLGILEILYIYIFSERRAKGHAKSE